jgi:hypothetical protein
VDASEAEVTARLQAHPRADVRLRYASDVEIVAAFAAADVVLLPHRWGSDSGSLHMARAVGRPVLSSDMAQLASVVSATGAGRVLPRVAAQWAEALSGDLPVCSSQPPLPATVGKEHLMAYRTALQLWRATQSISPNEDGPDRSVLQARDR